MFKKAVMFIHGFSAYYCDNEYLFNYLEKNTDFDIFTYTLSGHNSIIMGRTNYQKWIDESEKNLIDLMNKYNKIYLIGHSMGGVIASYLASKYPNKVKKLVLIAPAFKVGNISQVKNDLFALFKKSHQYETNGFEGLLTKMITVPKRRFVELHKLIRNYHSYIYKVKCPILFLQGDIDNVVSKETTISIYNEVKCKKYLTIVKGIRHKMFVGSKREKISFYISKYLKGGFAWYKIESNNL